MNSPISPSTPLVIEEIEPGLNAYVCPRSKGVWLPLQTYLTWLDRRGARGGAPEGEAEVPEVADDRGRGPLFCPESGALLIRYRVGRGLRFHLDRSPVTGGIWLDKGEWKAVRSVGLHEELHRIFTAPYQRALRDESYQARLAESFRDRIGEEGYEKALAFREWMAQHPKAEDIRALILERER